MNHAEDVVHTGRRVIEGHASVLWVVVLVGVAEWGMMGTCRPMSSPYMFPTSAQQYSIIPVEQTRGQCQTGRNDLPGKGERVASGW